MHLLIKRKCPAEPSRRFGSSFKAGFVLCAALAGGADAAVGGLESGPQPLIQRLAFVQEADRFAARREGLPDSLSVTNATLIVTARTTDGALSVLDRRTGRRLNQEPLAQDVRVFDARATAERIELKLKRQASGLELLATARLASELPELTVEVTGKGELRPALRFPHPFVSSPSDYLVVPMNEGISFPVEDKSIEPMRLIAYGGHGICMAFWGVTDGSRGHMAIIETPDDAAIRMDRLGGRMTIAPEWESQKGQVGYSRRLRYVFFEEGGHVAICKRYRAYAKDIGLLKTLAEKRRANPSVDLLIGAVNVWCWDKNPLPIVKELQAAGIERILWSNRQSPDGIRAMNDLGILTSRYDIYQDLMDPENLKSLRGVHPDWTTEGWPKDIMRSANGDWIKGWKVRGKDGEWYPCGVLCDLRAPEYAKRRVPPELAAHPYRCRFIDTTTASSWRECYAPEHPLTRSESRHWKMELLRYVSEDMNLVCGSETGHDAAVPFVHYFEGMLSLGPYRVPDAGRDMQRIWTEVPERVAKFQLGHKYRLPLWELVFHDCVVAQWYWGDYNNKLPELWDKRDLFNLLYGTPPMFMFNRGLWEKEQSRFVQSYRNTCPVVRAVGYSEMTDHRFLTPDRNVQQTAFANGVTVSVNFGTDAHRLGRGVTVPPMGLNVEGVKR
ncbi:MAG: hypothetical protein HY735_15465 [Verrucomicrobia bacterium]|nr:hypothetical protein [Verrucomicrobiota bacterium]